MIGPDYLYKRPVESDTETPRECHLQAMYSAYKNEKISPEVYAAVMNSAVVRKNELKESLDYVNSIAGEKFENFEMENILLRLSVAIVTSYGIDGPNAAQRRMQYLGRYFNSMLLTEEFGSTQ